MQELLTVRGLTRRYDRFTLDHIDFSLPYGSIMGLMGDNGAGKTTTLKLILNLIRRDEGEVLVFGKDNITCEREIKEEIGVVFDECHFPTSCVRRTSAGFFHRSIGAGIQPPTKCCLIGFLFPGGQRSRLSPGE